MPDEFVRVEGLTEFRKALRDAQPGLQKAMSEAHKQVAKIVVEGAEPKLTTKHGKRQAKVSIAASGTQGGAFVKLKGPTAFGAEFGASRFKQFKPHRGRVGYAVYPTIREKRTEIDHRYLDAVDESITRRAFPE